MHNWDFFRKQADTFDIYYELSRFNEATIKPYRETIKELKKLYKFPAIMRLNTHRLRRRMLIPKENARQRAIPDGIFSAIKDAIDIFKEAERVARDPYETLNILANKIKLRQRELEIAREQYDDRKTKTIYHEMFVTIEIVFLIDAWKTYLNQDKGSFPQKDLGNLQ